MKKSLIMTMLALMPFMNPVNAQTWNEPIVPHADLTTLTSDEIVYFYNVEADVFFVNGMDWNTNACATRLTNGNKDASGPQQCYVYVDDGNVRIKHKNSSSYFLSCLSNKANDIYVDQNQGYTFSFKETEEGSHFYTLTNNTYGGDLDLSWNNGGHLTIVGGVGLTTWAFIPESEIVGGGYALFKAKQQLYQLFKAIESAGKLNEYAEELDAAYEAYTSSNATYKTIEDAATLLFNSTFADITTPVDVSFLFKNADMAGKASVEGWTSITKDISWAEFELYHSAAKFSQTQIVPQGMYDVKLHAIWRNDGNDAAPVLAVTASNSVTADIPTIYDFTYNVGNTNNNGWTTTNGKIVPSGMQSASSALTQEGAVAVAKGAIVDASGNLTITFDIKSTSQWFNWQGLEIVYTGLGDANLKDGLKQIVAMAENLYGNGTGVMANELKAAIDTANDVMADGNASNKAIMGIEAQLKQLMADYKLANASVDDPIDYTSHIKNPSFEKGYDNWTVDGFGGQTNTSFTIKSDNTYMEKWTSKGNKVGDALLDQAISDLPLGVYILKVAFTHNLKPHPDVGITAERSSYLLVRSIVKEVCGLRCGTVHESRCALRIELRYYPFLARLNTEKGCHEMIVPSPAVGVGEGRLKRLPVDVVGIGGGIVLQLWSVGAVALPSERVRYGVPLLLDCKSHIAVRDYDVFHIAARHLPRRCRLRDNPHHLIGAVAFHE